MTPETIRASLKEWERQSDRIFAAKLLGDIPYFHKLYAKHKHPEALEAAKYLGIALDKLYKKWENPPVKE